VSSVLPATAKNICIVLLTGLGDVIHGLPIANALKRDEPTRRITWVVEPMPAPIVRHHPAVDDVVVYRKSRGVAGVMELARELSSRKLDLTLNLNVYFKSIWPTLFSGAPVRLGFDRDRARDLVSCDALFRAGATTAFPEAVEASLRLAAQTLEGLGLSDEVAEGMLQQARGRDYALVRSELEPASIVPTTNSSGE